MISVEMGVSGAVRMNPGYSGECVNADAGSNTRFYFYAE
jgi:hypothetical protein